MKRLSCFFLFIFCLSTFAVPREKAGDDNAGLVKYLETVRTALHSLHREKLPPMPGDWLTEHNESGETFDQYRAAGPITAEGKRNKIYIQPLGEFTTTQRKILRLTAGFIGYYFALPVKVKEDIPLSVMPQRGRRVHDIFGWKQIHSGYILARVLKPRLPEDAAAYIAITASDLWPGKGWNFVYGQAHLKWRVAVLSINRNGDPDKSKADYQLCLLRTLKTATHETGHMFSIKHCTAYECNMCGRNNREESDRSPMALCPQCLCKLHWATGADLPARFKKLASFCNRMELFAEAAIYKNSIRVLGEISKNGPAPKPIH
ncbi:MAG: hypothetical protein GY765_34930 [bacterium]|nr:hypothetical protein [bacterium]